MTLIVAEGGGFLLVTGSVRCLGCREVIGWVEGAGMRMCYRPTWL